MILRSDRRARGKESIPETQLAAASTLSARGWFCDRRAPAERRGYLLHYFPLARRNRFQSLIYGAAIDHGMAPIPMIAGEKFASAAVDLPSILHLHWLNSVLDGAKDESGALQNVREFEASLASLTERGVGLIWTLHNALPHVSHYPEAEFRLREVLVEHCDGIHLMHEDLPEEIANLHAGIREKSFCVPHPVYNASIPPPPDRSQARYELGLNEDTTVLLSFGAILSYKNQRKLAAAILEDDSRSRRDIRLIICGPAPDAEYLAKLNADCSRDHRIRLIPRAVTDEEAAHLFSAADATVFAYERGLNSGVAHLAVSYRCPILFPKGAPAFGPLAESGLTIAYEQDLMLGLDQLCAFQPEKAALDRFLSERSPAAISSQLCAALRGLPALQA